MYLAHSSTDPSGYEFLQAVNEAPDFWAQPTAELADRQHQSFMGWMAARGGGGSAHWRSGTGMDGSTTNPVTGVAQGFTTTDPALIAQLLTDPDARARYRKAANRGYYWEYSHTSYTADDGTHTVVGHSKKVWLREDPSSQGDSKWLFYTGTAADVTEEVTFSKHFNTWMGKDLKLRSQNWGGNGTTGGKFKFAQSTSKGIGLTGKFLGFWGLYNTIQDGRQGLTTPLQTTANGVSDLVGIFGGLYGAAWSFGWEAGKNWGPNTWFTPKPQESVVLEYMREHGMLEP